MFDRFTDRARKVMGQAKAEAQRLNHEYIGTEHILLGLVQQRTGVAANVLRILNVERERIRAKVEEIVKGDEGTPRDGNLPFTPRAKKVLEFAVESASNLGHRYIGTEHVLLGLIKEREGIAARVLSDLGVTFDGARDAIIEFLGVNPSSDRDDAPDDSEGQSGQRGNSPPPIPGGGGSVSGERRQDFGAGFDRFTDRARKVMALAKAEAQRLNHEYIGTEHLLLGFVQEGGGVGAHALKNMNVDLERVRKGVEQTVKGSPTTATRGNLPFTPRAKTALELAIEEAGLLGHNYVGTEHLLLGLIKEHEGIAARVLLNLGVKLDETRDEILAFLGIDPRISQREREGVESGSRVRSDAPLPSFPPSIAGAALETLARLPPAPSPDSGSTTRPVSSPVEPQRDVVDRLRRRLDAVRRAETQLRVQLAAHEYARGREAGGGDDRPKPTRRAREVVDRMWVATRQSARADAGSEQLLIALLDDAASLLPRCLAKVGLDVMALAATISRWSDRRATPPESQATPPAATGLSPELLRTLDRAYALAAANGRRHVAVGHFVLALLEDPADAAVAALVEAGVDLAALRREVEHALDDGGAADQLEALSEGLAAAAVTAGGLRFDFEQFEEELRTLSAAIKSLRLRVEG